MRKQEQQSLTPARLHAWRKKNCNRKLFLCRCRTLQGRDLHTLSMEEPTTERKMYLFSFCVKTKKKSQLCSQNMHVSARAKCKVLWILNSLLLLEQANHCLPSSSSKAQACRGRGATTRTILCAPTVIQARFWPTSA